MWKATLVRALDVFERHHLLDIWQDGKIRVSRYWDDEIKQAMGTASLAVVLLTPEAINSRSSDDPNYILETEFPFLRARQQRDKLPVFPVVCEPCNWKANDWLRATQAPNNSNPFSELSAAAQGHVFQQLASDIAEELSRAALADLATSEQPLTTNNLFLDRFPLNHSSGLREKKLIGREQELALLDLAYADAIARDRTLLILDGIEPLQYPPGPMGGQLRSPGVQSLLKQLARKANTTEQRGLCLVTTREPLTDLVDFQRREGSPWGSVLRVDLGNLTAEAGAALLHHAGANRAGAAEVKPDDKELLTASREVGGHALTLNLLGRFLARAHGGDIRRRDLVKFEEADRKEQGGTTFKMLAAFENWFAKSGEFGARRLDALSILGLFDRPVESHCIAGCAARPRSRECRRHSS